MKKLAPGILVCGIFFLACSLMGRGLPLAAGEAPREDATVLVRVNGSPILQGEFEWQWRRYLRRNGDREPGNESSGMSQGDFLEKLIRQEIACQTAQEAGFAPDAKAIADEVETLAGQFVDEKAFVRELARLGLSPELLKRQIEKSYLIRRWVDETFARHQSVSETEARAWYRENSLLLQTPEKVCARHLLAGIDPSGGGSARQQAIRRVEAMRRRWLAGESFSELCHRFSDCPSAAKEGDLGCFSRDEMVATFADAAFSLELWEVSAPVETSKGFHLIQVYERQKAATPPYPEVREKIIETLRSIKAQPLVDAFIEAKRREAAVEIIGSH